ncbi:hypothetical protein RchiOBHm_Chr2g0096351 [Rosa chinensis]|uniref:Uncharacterized protein n=1 Tax=Rosa chinensis TaxID=74649 RepID=A0A2P6RL17_ROSCH|nr:hypothetical protein RchiOBHm_Chr2g0096351 [Rosa chinensis]
MNFGKYFHFSIKVLFLENFQKYFIFPFSLLSPLPRSFSFLLPKFPPPCNAAVRPPQAAPKVSTASPRRLLATGLDHLPRNGLNSGSFELQALNHKRVNAGFLLAPATKTSDP